MVYEIQTIDILNQLGANKKYKGYTYIISSILYINERREMPVLTKMLYVDIAKKHNTSAQCVEKNIRKVIEVVWKNQKSNHALLLKIFGSNFLESKPSNKEFLELLYAYIKSHNLFEKILRKDNFICPISKDVCIAYTKIVEKLINF